MDALIQDCRSRVLNVARQQGREAYARSNAKTATPGLHDFPAWLAAGPGERVGDFTEPRTCFSAGWQQAHLEQTDKLLGV